MKTENSQMNKNNQPIQQQQNNNNNNKNNGAKCTRRHYTKINQSKQFQKEVVNITAVKQKKKVQQSLSNLVDSLNTCKNEKKINLVEQEQKNSHNYNNKQHDIFQQAVFKLSQNYIPKAVSCRDQQKMLIYNFILQGIKQKGQSQTLYISGVPGIGKTLCLNQIEKEMKKNNQIQTNMKYIYVNALKFKNPFQIFKFIWQRISGVQSSTSNSLYYLNQYFINGKVNYDDKTINATINIIAIDEFDYLQSKEEQVIYNIVQWTQCKKAKIILLAISNTIDFPDHLPNKISSRMGNSRLIFKPYSDQNISFILNERVSNLPVFQENALQYISKRVAKSSSDIRKCLNILKNSITTYIMECASKNEKPSKVSRSYLQNAYAQTIDMTFVKNFSHLHFIHKGILRALGDYFKYNCTSKLCTYTQLFARTRSYIVEYKHSLKQALIQLRDMGYINYKYDHFRSDKRVNKTISVLKNIQQEHIYLLISFQTITRAIQQEIEQ